MSGPGEYPVILPPNSTDLEKAMAAIDARRIGSLDVDVIQRIHDPDTCPEAFLPILAWEYSVDEWDPTWPVAKKREVIKLSYEIHRHKGTAYAIETAVSVLTFKPTVQEWFEYGGFPYRFRLSVVLDEDDAWFRRTADIMQRTALRVKNVRSRLEEIVVRRNKTIPVYVGGLVSRHRTLHVGQIPKPTFIDVTSFPRVGTLIVRHRKLRIKGKF